MINYILLAVIILLCGGIVIKSENRQRDRVRRARYEGMREGINMAALRFTQVMRTYSQPSAIDVDEMAHKLNTQVELEEWAEL